MASKPRKHPKPTDGAARQAGSAGTTRSGSAATRPAPAPTPAPVPARSVTLVGRSRTVPPGHLPVSEVAFDRAGAPSPFGDDLALPLPPELLTYQPPAPH